MQTEEELENHHCSPWKLHMYTHAHHAIVPGCGLLLSEIFLDEDRGGPSRGLLQALSMSKGKQRSASEYTLLLKSHGFITAHAKYTDNLLDAMLCIKVWLATSSTTVNWILWYIENLAKIKDKGTNAAFVKKSVCVWRIGCKIYSMVFRICLIRSFWYFPVLSK